MKPPLNTDLEHPEVATRSTADSRTAAGMHQDKSTDKLSGDSKQNLIRRFFGASRNAGDTASTSTDAAAGCSHVAEELTRFDAFPGYQQVLIPQAAARRIGLDNPFFRAHEGVAGATTRIADRECINFANYNYLGLSGDPRVNAAAQKAIEQYGTSVSASRVVSGERPIHQALEQAIAKAYGVDDTLAFVSGHATNVSAIGHLFGPKDLVLHDSLIHNSVMMGIQLGGAQRRAFPHNDWATLEQILADMRDRYQRVLIVIEGLYSMDGDIPDLPRFIDIKRRYQSFLMVDEAHSFGVLGARGMGIAEHFGIAGKDVDIWMGTFSKSLAGCGGYIAGEKALVEHLRYAAPGFVYSVGMAPPLAAASLEALHIIQAEPERVARLQERGHYFLQKAGELGMNTGLSQGYCVVPIVIGQSLKAVKLSNQLLTQGINVQPIIHPAVEEKAARLRFFISSEHTKTQIDYTLNTLKTII
ncbi:aminotransferase class I/II-fold pyridoxal phosphate-dependent enzyme [Halothiobacillus diazotrophicus]|nr:aminotransferase class I/II-fold pyridoxal phosphate-dependent enzyme [Halothiobacillus diazotrophicus]